MKLKAASLSRPLSLSLSSLVLTDMVPRGGGGDGGSTVIKLDTVRRIAEKVNKTDKCLGIVLFFGACDMVVSLGSASVLGLCVFRKKKKSRHVWSV